MRKKVFLIAAILPFLLMVACQKTEVADSDIMTQKESSKDKISVSVLVKYAFTINTFESVVEKKFPNLNLIQVGNFTSDMGIDEYEARLEHDDLTDIVMTWPLEVGKQYWSDRLIDLSSYAATSKYTVRSLQDISDNQNGKLYYLPGPSQIRGIVYNKTMFEANNWKVPKNYAEFVALCHKIEDTGIRALQLGLKNEEVLDTAFVGFGYGSSFSKPSNVLALKNFNEGKESFAANFTPALDTFQDLVNEGILKKSDLDISYSKRESMFFTRECAMVEDSVLMANMGYDYTGIEDEFALMPFFNPGADSDWARLYPICFIGLNKHLLESKNKEKYKLVLDLINYISTSEGQDSLMADTGGMFSPLKNKAAPNIPEINDMLPALNSGRYAVFPTLKNAQSALRKGLAGIVDGTLTKNDVIAMVDEQNLNPQIKPKPNVIGKASSDFTMLETGNFVTDVMRKTAKTDIALFLDNGKDGRYNGKGISAKLYKGDITTTDIKRIMPDLKGTEKAVLCTVTMTGKNLLKTLEYSIPINNNHEGWFYYFSGLKMEYAPAKTPGQRIKKITMADGTPIKEDQIYSVAVMDQSVKEYVLYQESTLKIIDMLEQEIANLQTVSPSKDGRFKIIY